MSVIEIDNLSPVQAYTLAFNNYHLVENSEFSEENYRLLADKIIASNDIALILNWASTFPMYQEEMVDIICANAKNLKLDHSLVKLLKRITDDNCILKIKYKILELFPEINTLTNFLHANNLEQSRDECLANFYHDLPAEIQLGIKL